MLSYLLLLLNAAVCIPCFGMEQAVTVNSVEVRMRHLRAEIDALRAAADKDKLTAIMDELTLGLVACKSICESSANKEKSQVHEACFEQFKLVRHLMYMLKENSGFLGFIDNAVVVTIFLRILPLMEQYHEELARMRSLLIKSGINTAKDFAYYASNW